MNQDIPQYNSLGYTGTGYLVVRVSTGTGAFPLSGATVIVRGSEPDFSAVIARLTSGEDGLTPKIALLAPPRSLSSSPTETGKPYASYNVEVYLDGYHSLSAQNIPIFDGITSIQPADMIPVSKNGTPDAFEPFGKQYTESDAATL
ncbi:MAG: hypothetical protein IJW69_02325 [Clostridia bacterium]|nr:hypothetical protein [Clostridia bacterium]